MSGELTLAALVDQPDIGDLTVLAGQDTAWDAVVVQTREEDLPDAVDQALAILVMPVPTTTWQVDALLRRVHDRGFTGLALSGDLIGPGSVALAERLGLVLLHSASPTALAQACWQVLEGRDALTLSTVRRLAASIEYQADDLDDLLRHVVAGIGGGVALVDGEGVLQSAGAPVPPPLLPGEQAGRWLEVLESAEGVSVSVPVPSRARRHLRVVLHSTGTSRAQRNALATGVQVVMPMVAARLLMDEVESTSDAAASAGLLGDFLDRRGAVDADLEVRMRARGWRAGGFHLGLYLLPRNRIELLTLLHHVRSALASVPVDAHATTRGAGISAWLTFPAAPESAVVADHVDHLRALHRELQQRVPVAMGVGSLGAGPTGLVATLDEARDAARVALTRPRAAWFFQVDQLGLDQLLVAWTDGDTFAAAARAHLEPLTGDERQTLITYLDEESSIVATAARLGVHRNTITTRIQRVQDRLGADLRDPATRLALHLVCRVAAQDAAGR